MTSPEPASDTARQARELFRELTGAEPVGTWSAPGRVNLIGEHTDYNDGFVLPFAIPFRTHVAVAPRTDGVLRVVSEVDPVPVEVPVAELEALFPARRDEVPEWARYPLGVAWALLAASGTAATDVTGADLAFSSDVPVGAGLSSSAAIEGATATALADTWGLDLDRVALARAGRTAENDAVGAPTGIMDQMASMLGEADAAIFLDCRTLATEVVDLGFDAADLELVVMDTGVKHSHATGGYGERRASCEAGAAALGAASLRDVTVDDVNAVVREAAAGRMGSVLAYDPEPKVSIDFNHTTASSIFAPDQTKVMGRRLVRVMAWYDNEWGFSARMADVAGAMGRLLH